MAESHERKEIVPFDLETVYVKLKTQPDWKLLFENKSKDEAEMVFLTGMFSGGGFLGLFSHGARKSMVFAKLFRKSNQTQVLAIAGGTESIWGTDFGRHKSNINRIFTVLG
ncbi:MAG: hypothetical protein ABIG39_03675 [Candidatus Micrarchaeota archaeon]